MITRRRFNTNVVASATALAGTPPAWAASELPYPSGPISLIVPYAAGGGTDVVARLFATRMEEALGRTIVIENRGGGGGTIAVDAVAGARPDGATLLLGTQGPIVINPHLMKSLKSDPELTLTPIGMIADAALVVLAAPKHELTSLAGLVALGRALPGGLTYGSASNGSSSHLAALLLERAGGFSARHVPYRGAGPALGDLLGGHIDFMVTTLPSAAGLIADRQLVPLAVTGATRIAALPDVPTASEGGLPGFVAGVWYGLFGPKELPAWIAERLDAAMTRAMQAPDLLRRLADEGAVPSDLRGAAFAAFAMAERRRLGEIMRAAGIGQ